MSHLITMQPGFQPPMYREADRLLKLANVRKQMLAVFMEEGPTSHALQELYDEESRLMEEGNGPR